MEKTLWFGDDLIWQLDHNFVKNQFHKEEKNPENYKWPEKLIENTKKTCILYLDFDLIWHFVSWRRKYVAWQNSDRVSVTS